MIVYKYLLRKHFNMFYLPINKVWYINFNRINEKHIWLEEAQLFLQGHMYEGNVVDYRNIKFDHSPRFVSVPFKKDGFYWHKAELIDGAVVIMEYIRLLDKLDVEVWN